MVSRVQSLKKNFSNLLRKPIEINRPRLAAFGAFFILGGGGVSACSYNPTTGEHEPLKLGPIEFSSNNPPPSKPAPTAAATPAPQQQRVATVNRQSSNTSTHPNTYPAQPQQTYQSGAQPMPSSGNMGANSPEMYGRTSTLATRGNNSSVVIDSMKVPRPENSFVINQGTDLSRGCQLPAGSEEFLSAPSDSPWSFPAFPSTWETIIKDKYVAADPAWKVFSDLKVYSEFQDKMLPKMMEQSFQCTNNGLTSTGLLEKKNYSFSNGSIRLTFQFYTR